MFGFPVGLPIPETPHSPPHVSTFPSQPNGQAGSGRLEPGPVCSRIWQCTVQLGVRLAALPSRKLDGEVLWYVVKSQSGRYFSCQETPAHSLTELYSWMLPTAARTMLDRNVGLRLTYDVVLSSITSSASSTTTARSASLPIPMWMGAREPMLPGSCPDRCRGVKYSRSHGLTHLKQPGRSAPLTIFTLCRSPWSGVWRLMG